MIKKNAIGFLLGCIWTSQVVIAGETPAVNVVQVGGQGGTMFIDVGQPVGADIGCGTQNQIRFPPGAFVDSDSKNQLYSAALMAMATGRKMRFHLSLCNGPYPYYSGTGGYWWMQ